MVEIFKNPQFDWIGAKKYFIGITIFLMVVGAIFVQFRGFKLGVDFSGGTLMTVRFKQMPALEQVRAVLHSAGIDTNRVVLQPITNRPNELIIRTPQLDINDTERRVDEDKRTIIRALQKLNPAGEEAAGKVNINSITAEGIEQELRQVDPLGINKAVFPGAHPYRQVGDQIVNYRDNQKGYVQDLSFLQNLPLTAPNDPNFDASKIKPVILERFYAGKIDLNLTSTSEIEDALIRINPLGTGDVNAYTAAAKAIGKYKTDRNGVINSLEEIQTQEVSADLLAKMAPYFTTGGWAVVSADIVGPQVGSDLRNRAIYVTLAALAGMLIYIAFRFEWIYGIAAVLAVFHDVMITLGLFSLFGWDIDLTVVAALLTLVGYSMNDTIVIFDRIRENLRMRRRDNLAQVTNDAINQTLSRTIITSGLTFISVVAIVLFGGDVLRGFGLALTIGIIIGTYSSIAVASPMMLWWQYITNNRAKLAAANARAARAA
ncbi:MAG: protein translocase subunit SecF [Acidobacteria bacterium]|nr:protein translocase subunit SecF [Acidobacteriota bacterium]